MKEQAGNQRNTPGEQTQQAQLLSRRSEQLSPRSPSVVTTPLPAIQEQALQAPSLGVGEHTAITKPLQSTSQETPSTAYDKPLSRRDTEPLPLLPTHLEAVRSQDIRPRLRRSREKPAEVSLEEVPILSNLEQYVSDVWQTKRLSREQEARIVEQARNGDQKAKHALIESCLGYVLRFAQIYQVYLEHDDVLDLVQIGNLAMTKGVDRALAIDNPGAYLHGIAKRAIRRYIRYHSSLISLTKRDLPGADDPTVMSLDTLTKDHDGEETIPFAIPEHQTPQETDQERLHKVREALDTLTDKQREVIEMRHGFHNQGAFKLVDIASHVAIPVSTIEKRYYQGMKRLRELLPTKGDLRTHP